MLSTCLLRWSDVDSGGSVADSGVMLKNTKKILLSSGTSMSIWVVSIWSAGVVLSSRDDGSCGEKGQCKAGKDSRCIVEKPVHF